MGESEIKATEHRKVWVVRSQQQWHVRKHWTYIVAVDFDSKNCINSMQNIMKRIFMKKKTPILIWLFSWFAVLCCCRCCCCFFLPSSSDCWYSISLYSERLLFKTNNRACTDASLKNVMVCVCVIQTNCFLFFCVLTTVTLFRFDSFDSVGIASRFIV